MSVEMMDDMWGTFNVREDQLKGLKVGDTFSAYVPAFDKQIKMRVYAIKDQVLCRMEGHQDHGTV